MIEVTSLRKSFGTVHAVAGVDLQVEAGTVLGLLGPNGAGKTTIVRVLSTLLRPDAGTARVAGHDVVRDADAVRRRIGLAGQYAAVDQHLTGRENLLLAGRLAHLPPREVRGRADELLDEFGLTAAARRPAATYSGGMRRRLDLAAALVARPAVVFLDEPTTGLDPASRTDLWASVRRLVADGTTVLLTTQYLEEADQLAHRIAVIDHGRVVAEGTPAELKNRLGATRLTVRFATPQDALTARDALHAVGTSAPEYDDGALTLSIQVVDGPAALADVVGRLNDVGVRARGLTLDEPSLDDVFLALTTHAA
jgi:daunorubicin resistance ABC transporter ATP-binding subunit